VLYGLVRDAFTVYLNQRYSSARYGLKRQAALIWPALIKTDQRVRSPVRRHTGLEQDRSTRQQIIIRRWMAPRFSTVIADTARRKAPLPIVCKP
jgi:hypothetical protein